jgi:Bacterial pre-peptidase C-terminal domain
MCRPTSDLFPQTTDPPVGPPMTTMNSQNRTAHWLPLFLGFLTPLAASQATAVAQPSVATTSPLAVPPGQTVDVTLNGGNLAGAQQMWSTFGGEAVLSPDVENNGQDAAKVVFRVTAPAETALGIHGIRVVTPGGVSSLRPLLVDDLLTVAEAGGNNAFESAQAITLPCAVDGRVDNLSRDFYRFEVATGQRISFEVFARRIGSPLDASMFLYDADGRELAYNDDAEGLSSDCQMIYTFPVAGSYTLEVRDIRYAGSGNHVYRLRVGDFPCVNVPVPLGVKRGTSTRIDFAGISVEDAVPAWIDVPADSTMQWVNVSTRRTGGSASAFTAVRVSDVEEYLEREPNNTPEQADHVTLGANLNGRFEEPGDFDRFTFEATKGQRFVFAGLTRQVGAPTDLMLHLYDANGSQVAAADDNGTNEGLINYTFPADGKFTLGVNDLNHRGGSQFAYQIGVEEYHPGFTLSVAADAVNIPAGGIGTITVNAARQDYGGAIDVTAEGLPEGVAAEPTRIGPGMNSVVLTVRAAPETAAGAFAPVSVVGTAKIGDQDVRAVASIEGAVRGEWSNVTLVPGIIQDEAATAVAPAEPLRLRVEPAEVVFGRELKGTVRVIAERGEGVDQQIELKLNPEQNGIPGNVGAELKPIPAGQNEVEIAFTGNDKAPMGPFTVVLSGTHTKDKTTYTVFTPGIGLRLEAPLSLQAAPAEAKLARGGELKVTVNVQRNPALSGEIKLTISNLPAGVTAAEVVVPADQNSADIALAGAADAQQGAANDITITGTAAANAKLTGAVKLPPITVE